MLVSTNLDFAGVARCLNLPAPSSSSDAVTKAYADGTYLGVPNGLRPIDLTTIPQTFGGMTTFLPMILWEDIAGTGSPGTAGDVQVIANAPFAVRVLDSFVAPYAAAVGSATLQLRGSAGGLGTIYSSAMSLGSTSILQRNTNPNQNIIAAGGSLYARFTDRATSVRLTILAMRHI